jgi:hypothetical protein
MFCVARFDVRGAGPFDSSIVRVTVTRNLPNVLQPWTRGGSDETSGTGFLIDGKRL